MVDLARTEAQMLAAIGGNACEPDRAALEWRIAGGTPAELVPLVAARLSRCYAHLPASYVSENLIDLIKKGLGNGYKWGNQRDPGKQLTVTAVTSGRGAVITISDEGGGFDVARVIRDRTFTHGGSGFSRFHRTPSVISYANGGRTLLIQFLSDSGPDGRGGLSTASAARSEAAEIDFHALKALDHVKVKCMLRPNSDLVATKITIKPPEERAVIEAPLQRVAGRTMRVLGLDMVASEHVEIAGADMRRAAFEQLQAGQIVEVTGSYRSARLCAERIKIRCAAALDRCELQGAIEELHRVEKRFRILGFVVTVDDNTEIRAGRESGAEPQRHGSS